MRKWSSKMATGRMRKGENFKKKDRKQSLNSKFKPNDILDKEKET